MVTRLLVKESIEHRVLAVQEAKHALFAGADGAAEDTAGAGRCWRGAPVLWLVLVRRG